MPAENKVSVRPPQETGTVPTEDQHPLVLYTEKLALLVQKYTQTVTHELRASLTTVYGYLHILKTYPPSMLQDSERSEMFSAMTDECSRAIRLLNNLLLSVQFQQVDCPQKFQAVPILLGKAISRALRLMDRELGTKNIQR